MLFKRAKEKEKSVYDTSGKIPVIRASICTGEQVAGFRDGKTGKFEEIMLIRSEADKKAFMKSYGISEDEIRKEW